MDISGGLIFGLYLPLNVPLLNRINAHKINSKEWVSWIKRHMLLCLVPGWHPQQVRLYIFVPHFVFLLVPIIDV